VWTLDSGVLALQVFGEKASLSTDGKGVSGSRSASLPMVDVDGIGSLSVRRERTSGTGECCSPRLNDDVDDDV
jgi:hypothetical protein